MSLSEKALSMLRAAPPRNATSQEIGQFNLISATALQCECMVNSALANLPRMRDDGFLKEDKGCLVLNEEKIQELQTSKQGYEFFLALPLPKQKKSKNDDDDEEQEKQEQEKQEAELVAMSLKVRCQKLFGESDYGLTVGEKNTKPLMHHLTMLATAGEWMVDRSGYLELRFQLPLNPRRRSHNLMDPFADKNMKLVYCDKHKPGCCVPWPVPEGLFEISDDENKFYESRGSRVGLIRSRSLSEKEGPRKTQKSNGFLLGFNGFEEEEKGEEEEE